jgi:hypothetical protein
MATSAPGSQEKVMADDTTPEQPGNSPLWAEGENAGLPEHELPPVAPPAAVSTAMAIGADAETVNAGGPGRRRSLSIGLVAAVAAAVLLVGAGIAWALASGGSTHSGSTKGHVRKASHRDLAPIVIPPAPSTTVGPRCPLTGLPTVDPSVPARPALAVKVDNYPQARPQSGLDQADIVFEEPVEGGITRLVAVFQCQSPMLIGPIRSARAVDLSILDELSKPILVHVGDINPVSALLQGGNLTDFDLRTHGSVIQTLRTRYAPYSTYVSAAGGWGLDPGDTSPPQPVFAYSATPPPGTPVGSIQIPFAPTNNTTWTWDAPSGHWLLAYSGVPASIPAGGQVSTSNIVVQTVQVTYGPWLENDVGGLEVQSQMIGSGPVTVLRNGVAITGTWHRAGLNDPTTLTASDGSAIALMPGQTWVEIVPSNVAVTAKAPSP